MLIQIWKVEVLVLGIGKFWPDVMPSVNSEMPDIPRWTGPDVWRGVYMHMRGWEDSWEGSCPLGKGGWRFASLVQGQWQWGDYSNMSRATLLRLFLTRHCSRLTSTFFQEGLRRGCCNKAKHCIIWTSEKHGGICRAMMKVIVVVVVISFPPSLSGISLRF